MRSFVYMAVGVAFVLALVGQGRDAFAQSYRVEIDTEPTGATLWIDNRNAESVGTAPYSGRLSLGKHTVFAELNGYEFAIKEIRVRKNKRVQRFVITLAELESGSIDILPAPGNTNADGATVLIDGEERGTVPDTFEVPAGDHEIAVVKEGFQRFEAQVTVKKGESQELAVTLTSASQGDGVVTVKSSVKTQGKSGDGPKDDGGSITEPEGARSPLLRFGVGMGAGFRDFSYDTPQTNNLRPYSAAGLVLVDLDAQLLFAGLSSASWLRPLSLFAHVKLSLPATSSTAGGNENITTIWLRREVGLRSRFDLGPLRLGLDLAEGGNSFSFSDAGVLDDEIAEVSYEYLRIGATVGLMLSGNDIGVGGDGLVVLLASGVADRFDAASVVGFRVHGWYRRTITRSLEAMLSGAMTEFSSSFTPSMDYNAKGSTDRMFDVTLSGSYQF